MKHISSNLCACAAAALLAAALGSCDNKKFRVSGAITEAKDSVLYFENMSLDGPVTVDSVKLDGDGTFSFSQKAPEAPEFYRLRIAGQIINLSIDSTETVTVKAAYPTMATAYTVEGSPECEVIKELALKQIDLLGRVIAIERNGNISFDLTRDSIARVVEAYKHDVKMNYIFKAPMRPSSYFALFQTLGNRLIFNPRESEDDIKAFAAVATSWDTYHPNSVRGENLHNIAIQGMRNVRIVRNQMAAQAVEAGKVHEANLIDISLLDNRQKERTAFSKRPFFPVQNMSMSEGDEEFMQQVMKVINEHMKDETFNVEALAEELALSRSSLLRKLKTLFNMSPIDFIRLVRLKKAAELIQDGRYRLNEICYMVGFNSHSYFSKLFCKQFGMTPKDFEKQVAGLREKVRNAQGKDFEALVSPQITPRPAKKAPEDKGKPQTHEEGHPPTA